MTGKNYINEAINQSPVKDDDLENRQITLTAENDDSNTELPINFAGGKLHRKYVAYTIKLPVEQLAALQSIWLELKRLYGAHSPDKSGMIQQAIADWLKKWEGPEHQKLLQDLLEIREDTRRRQYRKTL